MTSDISLQRPTLTNTTIANHGRRQQKWPHIAPHEALCQRVIWMGNNHLSKRIKFWGLLRVCMALKTLRCCGDASLPEQRSTLRAIHTLDPPKNTSASLGGCHPSIQSINAEGKASCGALGGHFHRRQAWLWQL